MAKKRLPAPPPNNLLIDQYGTELSGGVNRLATRFRPQALRIVAARSAGKPLPSAIDISEIASAEAVASKFISRAVKNTTKIFEQSVKSATGIKTFKLNPVPLDKLTNDYIANNVSLIKSIPEKLHSQLTDRVQDAFDRGVRPETLANDIEERFGVAESRARFIARDQLSKLNGALNKSNQQEIGVELYYWRTAMDDKVRDLTDDNHRAMEGMLCRWDDPSVFSVDDGETWQPRSYIGGPDLEPGEDYNCRCTAEAVLPSAAELENFIGIDEEYADMDTESISLLSGIIGASDIAEPSYPIAPTHPPTHPPTHLPSNRRRMTV